MQEPLACTEKVLTQLVHTPIGAVHAVQFAAQAAQFPAVVLYRPTAHLQAPLVILKLG